MTLDIVTNPQHLPTGYTSSTNAIGALEYLRLEEGGYVPLYLSPTSSRGMILQDFDLGKATPRPVQEGRALGDGVRDYSRYLGAKSVSLTVLCRTDAYGEATYYASLVSSWYAPFRRPTLVYRLRGLPECRISLRGSQLGVPLSMPVNRSRALIVNGQWVGLDGKDYATTESTATLSTGDTGTVVTTYGSADADPMITVNGPQPAGLVIISDTAELRSGMPDARLGLSNDIASGDWVVIDTRERTVQHQGLAGVANSWRRYLTPARWFGLVAATANTVRLTGAGSGTIAMSWHDSYV